MARETLPTSWLDTGSAAILHTARQGMPLHGSQMCRPCKQRRRGMLAATRGSQKEGPCDTPPVPETVRIGALVETAESASMHNFMFS